MDRLFGCLAETVPLPAVSAWHPVPFAEQSLSHTAPVQPAEPPHLTDWHHLGPPQ